MPTYTYACDSCGNRFDIFQKFSDEPVRDCPSCGNPIRKVFHASGIVFKGSGWYINDSRPKASDSGSSDSKSDSTTDTKTEAKTDSKSEPKTETKTESKTETKSDSKPASKTEAA